MGVPNPRPSSEKPGGYNDAPVLCPKCGMRVAHNPCPYCGADTGLKP